MTGAIFPSKDRENGVKWWSLQQNKTCFEDLLTSWMNQNSWLKGFLVTFVNINLVTSVVPVRDTMAPVALIMHQDWQLTVNQLWWMMDSCHRPCTDNLLQYWRVSQGSRTSAKTPGTGWWRPSFTHWKTNQELYHFVVRPAAKQMVKEGCPEITDLASLLDRAKFVEKLQNLKGRRFRQFEPAQWWADLDLEWIISDGSRAGFLISIGLLDAVTETIFKKQYIISKLYLWFDLAVGPSLTDSLRNLWLGGAKSNPDHPLWFDLEVDPSLTRYKIYDLVRPSLTLVTRKQPLWFDLEVVPSLIMHDLVRPSLKPERHNVNSQGNMPKDTQPLKNPSKTCHGTL